MFEGFTAFLIWLGINPSHIAAGAAGAIVRSLLAKGATKWEKFTGGFVGTLCAAYLTPLFVFWMGLDPSLTSTINAVGFGIGLIGMSLAEGAVRIAHNWSVKPRLPGEASLKGLADAVNPAEPIPPVEPPIAAPEKEQLEEKAPVRRKRGRKSCAD